MGTSDIICAISTPPGMGAIAILRLSGKGSISLVEQIFESPSNKLLSETKGNTVHFGSIHNNKELIDEVLVTIFRAPHSFTGEESVEISCHGSVYIQQTLLKLLVDIGARLALPGEFTQRAFFNGKMDLAQAEAVADLVASSSAASHRMALSQMKGGFSSELTHLRLELLHITSLLELELDFSEEDIEFADRQELRRIASDIECLLIRLCDSFSLGNVLKNGVPVAIVGNTNVGKSTLLNAFLSEERAIVSDIAGTTRDTIEDTINLDGITFRFTDTAGIRSTTDEIENIGIERTFTKIEQANIVLLLIDLKCGMEYFEEYYKQVKIHVSPNAHLIIVLNKIDEVKDLFTPQKIIHSFVSNEKIIPISARMGINLNTLIHELVNIVKSSPLNSQDVVINNVRHYEALSHALEAIQRVKEGLQAGLSGEFISQDIRECLRYLGEITGDISTNEILNHIFGKFCIGK